MLLIIAEIVITIFQPVTCISFCFFAFEISKMWKLLKFSVVQSGPKDSCIENLKSNFMVNSITKILQSKLYFICNLSLGTSSVSSGS